MLLACCLMATVARAQPAGGYRVDVGAYGLVSGTDGVPAGFGTGGIAHREGGSGHIVQVTTRIPACMGNKFGFVYSVIQASGGAPVQLTSVYRFPPPGLRMPGVLSPIPETRFEHKPVPGMRRKIISYKFDHSWELVQGEWTIELRDGGRVVASKTFTVVTPGKGECPVLSV
jgi:hypothetical protein